MSAETETYAILAGAMGSPPPVDDRIYPDALPLYAVIPAIVFRRVGTEPVMTLQGPAGAARVQIQIDSWAGSREAAEALANIVQAAMIDAAHVPGEREGIQDDDTGQFAVVETFDVWEV